MRKKLKFFVSTENKILLHLKRFIKVEATKKVPKEITQVGIAQTLGSPRGSVSRALGNLISKGFVEEKLCRVESSKRRMNAYFLTWEGRTQEEDLENKLASELVEARSEDGTLSEYTIAEALELSDNELTLSELLGFIEVHGYYDPMLHKSGIDANVIKIGETVKLTKHTAVPAYPEVKAGEPATGPAVREIPPYMKVPSVRTFYGRTNELEEYPDLFKEYPVIIIKGMAGIGKTTLTAKVLSQFDPTWKTFWYRLQEWDSARSILQAFAEFFNTYEHSALIKELEAHPSDINMYNITKILMQEFHTMKAIIVFDDFHRASETVQQLFSGIIENLDAKVLIHLVLLSRTHLPVFDQRDSTLKKLVHEAQLSGLDMDSSRDLLGGKKVSEQDLHHIFSVTSGHPLALELIKNSGRVSDFSDMMKFINEQVFQKLSKSEKAALMSISVHRKPVSIQGFLIEDEADFEVIDELINKTLLFETEPSKYDIHDLIREFFYSRLIAKVRKEYHLNAALYYDSRIDEELNALEAVYHYIKADSQDKAAEIMITHAPLLIEKGYLDEAMAILTKFDSSVSTEYLARLYTLKGDILSTWGQWDNVFEYYWQCYFLNLLENIPESKEELLKLYGYIGWKTSEIDVALGNLRSSIEVLSSSGDVEGVTEIENSLAWLLWMTGNYAESEVIYKKLYDKMKADDDKLGAAKILLKLGNVYWGDEDLKKSTDSYDAGLYAFRELKDVFGMARSYSHLALVEIEKGNFEKSIEYHNKCISLSEKNQLKRVLGYVQLHKLQSLMLQGDLETASAELEKARSTFSILNDMLGLAYLSANEGYILKLSKQNKRAIGHFEDAIHYLRGFLMPYYKSKLYSELSNLYKLTGESDKAADAKSHAQEKQFQKEE